MSPVSRFPIRFDRAYAWFSRASLLPPSAAFVDVGEVEVSVRMGWAFAASFPRTAVAAAGRSPLRPWSRGAHGFGGRWLVNGSADGLVLLRLSPPQSARVAGFRVSLRELLVSVEDPQGLLAALAAPGPSSRSAR
jgi:hypothetical protein